MAFSGPGQYAAGATASTTLFTTQPIMQRWIRAPRQGRRDNGTVQHGRDTLVLVMATNDAPLSQTQAAEFYQLWNTAKAQAGRIFVKAWDQEASSGAGAYATDRYIMEPIDSDMADAEGLHWNMSLVFRARGIPA